jgi:hypothetical protein
LLLGLDGAYATEPGLSPGDRAMRRQRVRRLAGVLVSA